MLMVLHASIVAHPQNVIRQGNNLPDMDYEAMFDRFLNERKHLDRQDVPISRQCFQHIQQNIPFFLQKH